MSSSTQFTSSARGLFPLLLSLENGERKTACDGISYWISRSEGNLFSLGAGCYLAARYGRVFSLQMLPQQWCRPLLEGVEKVENRFTKPQPCPLVTAPDGNDCREGRSDVHVSVLGALYGGLRQLNSYIKDVRLQKISLQIRRWVFASLLRGDVLCGNTRLEDGDFDLLLACEPFGLFEPEDLVLVEAVKGLRRKLPKSDALPGLLTALYWTEQGHYGEARMQLKAAEQLAEPYDPDKEALRQLVEIRLARQGQLGENMILHRPEGNQNRYHPGKTERIPFLVKTGKPAEIRVATHPCGSGYPVLMIVESTERGREVLSGEYIDGTSPYTAFRLNPFSLAQRIVYRFQLQGGRETIAESEDYCCDILGCSRIEGLYSAGRKERLLQVDGIGRLRLTYGSHSLSVIPVSASESGSVEPDSESASPVWFQIPQDRLVLSALQFWHTADGRIQETEVELEKTADEAFYGFGERYNAIDQAGEAPDVYVFNQYKDQGIRTYIPMPYYLSSRGYGIYLDTERYSRFDMGQSEPEKIKISVESDRLSLECFTGTPSGIIQAFTARTGRPKGIPRWALGPWMSSNNWDSRKEVMLQAETSEELEIPSTVLVIEAWSDEATFYIFNDAVYRESANPDGFSYEDFSFPEEGRWPDPRGMVESLHEKGLKCILWQIPVIKYMRSMANLQKERDEKWAVRHDYVVANQDGSPYRIPEDWFKDSLILDFTNPEARQWWFSRRRYLVREIGVDGFKTDGGECVFGRGLRFADGRCGKDMRNAYPNEYIGAYSRFLEQEHPDGGLTFSRAGYTGCGQYPAHWAGDERSTFDAFRRSLHAGLSAGLSGILFWGWDFAGFSGEIPTAELYIRSAEMAAFCPIMQYHAESRAQFNQDRTPWNIAERRKAPEVLAIYRYYANLRMNMLPYLDREASFAAEAGLPMMRALLIDYPDDSECRSLFDQYLLGRDILIAPVIEEGASSRSVYLPKGRWINFFTAEVHEGGRWIMCKAELGEIPVFQRGGSIVPLQLGPSWKFGEYGKNRTDGWKSLTLIGDEGEIGISDEGKPDIRFSIEGDYVSAEIDSTSCIDFTLGLLSSRKELFINGKVSRSSEKREGRYLHLWK